MKGRKNTRNPIDYGTEKQTIPVYIPDSRYRALKTLALNELKKPLNQVVRDAIEEVYGEELDRLEQVSYLHNDEQESSQDSTNADERIKLTA